ncbi:hypothetical protein BASA81_013830 [Batrachochytrium salamandrivorans]|nr:hypothetical protein BASA81_013830 [Batrachochytrium salamandrivorans]
MHSGDCVPQPPVSLAKWLADTFKAWEEKTAKTWEEKTARTWGEKTANLRELVLGFNTKSDQQALAMEGRMNELSERLVRLEANQQDLAHQQRVNGPYLATGLTLGGLALSAPLWCAAYVTYATNVVANMDGAKPKKLSKVFPLASWPSTHWLFRAFK